MDGQNCAHQVLCFLSHEHVSFFLELLLLFFTQLRRDYAFSEIDYLTISHLALNFFWVGVSELSDCVEHEELQVVYDDLPLEVSLSLSVGELGLLKQKLVCVHFVLTETLWQSFLFDIDFAKLLITSDHLLAR